MFSMEEIYDQLIVTLNKNLSDYLKEFKKHDPAEDQDHYIQRLLDGSYKYNILKLIIEYIKVSYTSKRLYEEEIRLLLTYENPLMEIYKNYHHYYYDDIKEAMERTILSVNFK